ncbi:MAG: 3-phosphoshikimate 1-carboxyvinyltransferase [Candidatus Marinimicrobia bacterium]|nr:3-phosphoshikimate 1-carboxyvinyltransferase [Candidatus Neomarinimicrobiota bacterium]
MADVRLSKLHQLNGELTVPGDKSTSHRAAMFASIGEGISRIKNYSSAIDCQSTLDCMRSLGADIRHSGQDIHVYGKGLRTLREPDDVLNCGNSGTTMRLLCGLLAGQNFSTVLTGDASLRRRPMDRIIKPLVNNGAEIYGRQSNRLAPLYIKGRSLSDVIYELPVASSQVKSAVLLAGLYADGDVRVIEPMGSRDHTERMLAYCGVDIQRNGKVISLGKNRQLSARDFQAPGDISSAAFLIALGLLVPGSHLRLKDVGINPTRTGLLTVLERMGADLRIDNERSVSNEPVGDIVVPNAKLKAVEIGGTLIPKLIDELPLIAVIATQAEGRTVVKDALELRIKESDRIAAIVGELKKMGASIEESDDGFVVDGPTPLHAAECKSYDDHRIAMALSVAAWIADGESTIQNADCVGISFPEFYDIVHNL